MEETYKSKVIVLDRKNFREYDIKADIYSLEKGRLEFVVRGAKKPESKLAGHLEPLCLSTVMIIHGRQLDYIGSATAENSFVNLKSNFNKIICAGEIIGIFKKIVKKGEPDKELFYFLKDFLDFLEKNELADVSHGLLVNFFILKLLSFLGYEPELYNCVLCGKKASPGGNKFDLAKGGLICGQCSSPLTPLLIRIGEEGVRLTISDDCIKVLRLAVSEDFKKILKLKISEELELEAVKIIGSFHNYNLDWH